jgi:hypothetical protein
MVNEDVYAAALWEIYMLSGADTDGDKTPAPLIDRTAVSHWREIIDAANAAGCLYRQQHADNSLGFCCWCAWCLDCHPLHPLTSRAACHRDRYGGDA